MQIRKIPRILYRGYELIKWGTHTRTNMIEVQHLSEISEISVFSEFMVHNIDKGGCLILQQEIFPLNATGVQAFDASEKKTSGSGFF
jgi:hypothetical protein